MYLLRLGLGPDSWMRKWEQPLTLIIWIGISFQLIGWFEAIQNTLNDINLLPGRGQFTLWACSRDWSSSVPSCWSRAYWRARSSGAS